MKPRINVLGSGGGTITKNLLFAVLIVFSIAIFCSSNLYATNDTQIENGTNLTENHGTSNLLINNSTSTSVNTAIISKNISNVTNTANQAAGGNLYTNVTVNQIKVAASNVRAYVETNYRLPDYVTIGTSQVTMSQFLELLTSALLQINNGNNNAIPLKSFNDATNPKEEH